LPKWTARRPAAVAGRVFVDTGAWVALFSARDQRHGEAERLFRHAASRRIGLLTTNLVLAELHRLLLFRAGVRPAAAALARVDESALVVVDLPSRAHHRAARDWLTRLANHPITYTDAVSFAMMRTAGCERVMTFDSDFRTAGFERWEPHVTPAR
jgi:predicted nucleic acid-binding protein